MPALRSLQKASVKASDHMGPEVWMWDNTQLSDDTMML